MNKVACILVAFLFGSCLLPRESNADVGYESPSRSSSGLIQLSTISITGTISKDDIATFRRYLPIASEDGVRMGIKNVLGKGMFNIFLDSQGGHLETAIQIGELIRQAGGVVTIKQNGSCASSCVFILAAGASRNIQGRVGIHRPYSPDDYETNPAAQKAHYSRLKQRAKAYLSEVNVPTTLYDRMLRIPPEQMKWLTKQELSEYGLSEADPYFQEATSSDIAKKMGLTKAQYFEMLAEAEKNCSRHPNPSDCQLKSYSEFISRIRR